MNWLTRHKFMTRGNQNLEKNNSELKNNIQDRLEPNRKGILKNAILATLCCWFLSAFLCFVFKVGLWDMIDSSMYVAERQKEYFGKVPSLFSLILQSVFYSNLFDYLFFSGIVLFLPIGFYLALKKKRGFFFHYPLISLILGYILYFPFVLGAFFSMQGGKLLWVLIEYTSYLFISSVLIIKLFYIKKEHLFFRITAFLFTIFLISISVGAKYSITTNNPKLCEIMPKKELAFAEPSLADNCFLRFAKRIKNSDFCKRIRDRETRSKCYQVLGKCKEILEKCQNFSDPLKNDECVKVLTREQEIIKLKLLDLDCLRKIRIISDEKLIVCKSLTNSNQKECIKNIALATNDLSLCILLFDDEDDLDNPSGFNINSPDVAEKCVEEIIMSGKRSDSNVCEKEFNTELEKNICFSEVAVNKNNLSMCRGPAYLCHLALAVKNNDPSICGEQQDCLEKLAIRFNNPEYCKLIGDNFWKNSCLRDIALNKNDISICQEIDKNSFFREFCEEKLRK